MYQNPVNPNHHKLKVVFVGDSGVGKSSIIARYSRSEFNLQTHSTIGVEFATRQGSAIINNVPCELSIQLWDTAGQERFRAIMNSYFKNALGVVLVYDITKHESFENLLKWYGMVMETCNEFVSLMVMGNKRDLRNLRTVPQQEAASWARQRNAGFSEVSSLLNDGIDEAIEMLIMRTAMSHIEIVDKLNTLDANNAGISRYSQASRASVLTKEQPYKEKQLRSCC